MFHRERLRGAGCTEHARALALARARVEISVLGAVNRDETAVAVAAIDLSLLRVSAAAGNGI